MYCPAFQGGVVEQRKRTVTALAEVAVGAAKADLAFPFCSAIPALKGGAMRTAQHRTIELFRNKPRD